jgi:hypothetical protein
MQMRRTAAVITITAAAVGGIAAAGLSQATAAPAETTVTRTLSAEQSGSHPGGPGSELYSTRLGWLEESERIARRDLRDKVETTRQQLNARPGVREVRVDCDAVEERHVAPFQPGLVPLGAVLRDPGPYPQDWAWSASVRRTCTFTLVR